MRCSTPWKTRCSTSSRRQPTCCPCSSSARRCVISTASTTRRSSSTTGSCSEWCRSRICRPTGSSTSAVRWPRATTSAASSGWAGELPSPRCRSVRTCCSPPPICPASSFTSRSARTCSCRYRRARPRRLPARPCSPTFPAARSPSGAQRTAACSPARRRLAAWRHTCTPLRAKGSRRPTWRGTGRR